MINQVAAFEVKPYSKEQLRLLYGVGVKTFKSWLRKIPDLGDYQGKCYTPAQVKKITDHLGAP